MNLHQAVELFVSLKRSLGAVFSADRRILKFFGRTLGDVPLETISPEMCRTFCRGTGAPTRWWERKYYTLRGFFAFMVSRGHLVASPLPAGIPRIPKSFLPYIYSREEIQRLLAATDSLKSPSSPVRALTYRTIILVLYAAGLRPSEGLRLRCCDVDLEGRVLSIWDTKFFKSRLVPFGADLARVLGSYRAARQLLPMPDGPRSAFFASRTGRSRSLNRLEAVFAHLRALAGIRRSSESRWQPRLHDLRHTFAVHRLIAWYQDGVDVQVRLPLLSTYLGHINISGTQSYLTMTPALLAEASKRFELYVSSGEEGMPVG